MRSKALFFVALFIFSILLLGTFVCAPLHSNALSETKGYSLVSLQTFNQYGQFSVNETLHSSAGSTPISSITFGFPASFQAHLVALSSYAEDGSTPIQTTTMSNIANDTLLITLSFAQSFGATNATAGLGFWVLNSFQNINDSGYYFAPILASPYVSIHLDLLNSTINFPDQTTYVSNTAKMQTGGFVSSKTFVNTPTYNGEIQSWKSTVTNVTSTLKSFYVSVYSEPSSTGYLDFTSITRQVSINPSGQIFVKDTLDIHNLGLNTISTLGFTPLTSAGSIIAVPSNEPPLSNVESISVSGNELSLNSTNQAIQPNSYATLIFQYPLSTQYYNVSDGIYTLSLPTRVPVGGIVDEYKIYSTLAPGVMVIGHQLSLSAAGANQIGTGIATLKFRMGIASATSEALPIASILFAGVFVAGVVFRPKSETSEDVVSIFDDLVKAIEEKVSSTNEILSELRSKGGSVSRNELMIAKSRIDDVRSKSGSRIGTIRTQLPQTITTSVQTGLNEVLATDREFDRVVRDILNNYDQVVSKRMKEDTFSRIQQSNSRRLQGTTNSLIDRAHDLREEYESES